MRRYFSIISLIIVLFIFSVSLAIASQPVNIEAAKRAAEYHGELLFEKDLKVCDYEVLHWAWGEPAVYVFTLIGEGDFYPSNILLDNTLLQGAYLVSTGQEEAGYLMMAQADRYMTVYVGATTDMPSFIKAHAGLPEHIVIQPLMRDLPGDPYWIYGDLFHILLTSKSRFGTGDTKATEIHLKEIVDLKELGTEKAGAVPAYAEQIEWGQFISPGAIPPNEESPYLTNVIGVLEGWHQLTVDELNLKGTWQGCASAAFYNCVKYLEKKGRVNTGGKDATFLQNWISICFRANPDLRYQTISKDEVDGAMEWFRGCGYSSSVTPVYRTIRETNWSFLTKFANEINSTYPCLLSRGKGIFENHVTVGIGYWKKKALISLVVHDGWASTPKAVTIKYLGYPKGDLVWPDQMFKVHPGGKGTFMVAKPIIEGPNTVRLDTANSWWAWQDKITSTNNFKVETYAVEYIYYDATGKEYKRTGIPRGVPYYPYPFVKPRKCTMKDFEAGTVKEKYFLIDGNGHLLVAQKTIRLVGIGGYTGLFSGTLTGCWIWSTTYRWKDIISATVTITVSGSGTSSDPYRGSLKIDGSAVETGWYEEDYGPYKCGLRGVGIVSGAMGQIVVSPAKVSCVMLEMKPMPWAGPYTVSFTGKKGVGDTITGTITFDEDSPLCVSDAPIVKTIVLTKS